MTAIAYYNEFEPYAAQWLRNLISANMIAPGDVDERSIVDVNADDLKGYTQCHFFAGIGGWSHALRLAGWPDDRRVWTGSCPCQPLSSAGKQKGHLDKRHLWPAFFGLISECRPAVPSRENGFIGWPAPTAQDAMGSRNRTSSRKPGAIFHGGTTLTDAAVLFGLPQSQWKAPTVPGVYCHPELSSWLMGYPKAWAKCVDTAMPSSRRSRHT